MACDGDGCSLVCVFCAGFEAHTRAMFADQQQCFKWDERLVLEAPHDGMLLNAALLCVMCSPMPRTELHIYGSKTEF